MKRISWLRWLPIVLLVVACAAQPTPTPLPTASATSASPTPTAALAATPSSPAEPATFTTEVTTGITYAKVSILRYSLDVYAPSEPGPWPVVVVVHGAIQGRESFAPLAEAIASQGAVVYNISVPLTVPWSTTIECIACAVRFARATAADYGGDPSRITLVANSGGAATGAVVALAGDDFDGDCVVRDASALPDALVAFEGPFKYATGDPLFDHTYLQEEDPELWEAINPYSHIGRNPGLQVRLVSGDHFDVARPNPLLEVSIEFHQALVDAGYDVELIVVENATHVDLLDPYSPAFAPTVQQALEVALVP